MSTSSYLLFGVALLATACPLRAQTDTVATVDGTILASDGSRILYVPRDQPNDLRIRLSDGQEQVVFAGSPYRPTYGYLTPAGAIFAADVPSQNVDRLFLFNGSNAQAIASLNGSRSLVAEGNYAVFSGDIALLPTAIPNSVYWMNTATGQVVQMPGDNGNIGLDASLQGIIAYWSSDGYSGSGSPSVDYNIIASNGTFQTRITNTLGPIVNIYPVTDGTNFVFTREPVCCDVTYSNLILSDGVTETLLRTSTSRASQRRDYEINAGWVAYRDTNGTLMLRNPSGVTSAVGASTAILAVSEFGDVAYRVGTEAFLRLSNGQSVDIGSYSAAFNIGRDWYFYVDGRLVRYADGRLVALDAVFAANPNPYTTIDGATLYGVSDIEVPRTITLTGQTTLDTRQFQIMLSGALTGSGRLDIGGGGTLLLRGPNTYSGGTSIVGATLVGDSTSLRGAIANSATLVFDQNFDGAFQGVIAGTGTIRKTGSGLLTLAGTQPYSGMTLVEAGAIHLQAIDTPSAFQLNAGFLSGTGRIGGLSATGGIIRPGAPGAVITSNGALTFGPAATFVADLAVGGAASQLTAEGNASLGGASLVLAYAPGNYRLGDSWTLLTAASIDGSFGTVDAPPLRLISPSLIYSPTAVKVRLVLNRPAFTALATTPNQMAAAGAAAELPVTSPLLGELVTLSDDGIRGVLSSLSGELHASTIAVLADATTFAHGAMMNQLESGGGGVWGEAATRRATIQASGEPARVVEHGRDYIAGADVALPGIVGGVAAWYGDANADGRAGDLDYSKIGIGLYGRADLGPLTLRVTASRTWYDIHTARQVSFVGRAAFSERLTAKSRATSTEGVAEAAIPRRTGSVTLAPFAGIHYQHLDLARVVETGGEASLMAGRRQIDQAFSRVGINGRIDIPGGLPSGSIRASAAWEHALSRPRTQREIEWPAANGADFVVTGVERPRDLFEAALGAEYTVSHWHFGAGTTYEIGGGFEAISGKLTVRFEF